MPDGDTRELQLLRGTLVLDSVRAGSTAPEVSVLTPAGGEVVADALAVRWSTRERDRDDFVRLLIQYSPDLGRTWVPLVTDRPAAGGEETASFDVESLPGSQPGEAVVRVVATDGLHAGIDVSAPFTLLHHPPRVFITSPGAGQTIQAGAAVVLRGFAMDVEDGGRVADTLAWTLDGQPAGEGAEQLVAGLAPGMHRARLAAQDTQGSEGEATVDFRVAPLGVAAGDEPTLDGDCSDDAYGRAVTVGLRPYADGMQATVQILRTASALWTCFSGLDRGGGTPLATAGITVDGDASGGSVAGLADRAFLVAEDGSLRALVGDGIGGFTAGGPEALRARISATDEAWQAELRIDTAALGAAQPGVAIAFGHFAVRFLGDDYTWPSGADRDVPSTWGSTVLGDLPDEDCDDGDPCTQDRYQPDTGCRHDSVSGCCREDRDCGDTDTCDGATRCVEARCVSFPPVSCEDDDPCTSNVCVPEHGCTTIHTVDLDGLRCRLAAIEALLRAAPEDGFRGPPLRHLLLQHIVRLQRLVRSGHGPRVGLRLKALESRLRVFLKLAGRFIVDGPLARSVIRLGTEALAEMPALRSIYPSAGTPPGHAKP
jgi:hypothetical protein